jgi:hypothetical protein
MASSWEYRNYLLVSTQKDSSKCDMMQNALSIKARIPEARMGPSATTGGPTSSLRKQDAQMVQIKSSQ